MTCITINFYLISNLIVGFLDLRSRLRNVCELYNLNEVPWQASDRFDLESLNSY